MLGSSVTESYGGQQVLKNTFKLTLLTKLYFDMAWLAEVPKAKVQVPEFDNTMTCKIELLLADVADKSLMLIQ